MKNNIVDAIIEIPLNTKNNLKLMKQLAKLD